MSEEELSVESLKKSINQVGPLYPILVNQDGKVLDGNTRILSNPDHPKQVRPTKNRIEEILVRVHAHHRRRISQEETRALVIEMAEELVKAGTPKESVSTIIVDSFPHTPSYIRSLLPQEYKEPMKVEAAKASATISAQKKYINDLAYCEGCKTHRSGVTPWHGRLSLCPDCMKNANATPEVFEHAASIKNGEAKVLAEKQKQPAKPLTPLQMSTWQHRKSNMEVPMSKAEIELGEDLANDSTLRPITHQSFTVGPTTTPDYFLPRHNLAIYYDGKVHEGKEDKDEELRNLLMEWYPQVKVCVVTFKETRKERLEKIRMMV